MICLLRRKGQYYRVSRRSTLKSLKTSERGISTNPGCYTAEGAGEVSRCRSPGPSCSCCSAQPGLREFQAGASVTQLTCSLALPL